LKLLEPLDLLLRQLRFPRRLPGGGGGGGGARIMHGPEESPKPRAGASERGPNIEIILHSKGAPNRKRTLLLFVFTVWHPDAHEKKEGTGAPNARAFRFSPPRLRKALTTLSPDLLDLGERVGALLAGYVLTVAAVHLVVPGETENSVISGAAEEEVIAGVVVNGVVAGAGGDEVIAGAAAKSAGR
jgi:hypothetical protein